MIKWLSNLFKRKGTAPWPAHTKYRHHALLQHTTLLDSQFELLKSTEQEVALVGGSGAGKTRALCEKVVHTVLLNAQANTVGVLVGPHDGFVKRIFKPGITAVLDRIGLNYTTVGNTILVRLEGSPRVVGCIELMNPFECRRFIGKAKVEGTRITYFGMDEPDLFKPNEAAELWNGLLSICDGQGIATGSSEGFNGFLYKHWSADVNASNQAQRRLIRARTADNTHLPEDFAAHLAAVCTPEQLKSYLDGEFPAKVLNAEPRHIAVARVIDLVAEGEIESIRTPTKKRTYKKRKGGKQ